jgi:hypothetical protein
MALRPIRLGISLAGQCSVGRLVAEARRAELIGFDVVLLIDHLDYAAPLPPLVAIAAAAPSVRVGNLVLNASFYRPALLARDLASVDSATGGRLEIGLGAGHAEQEFAAAGLPFPKARHASKVVDRAYYRDPHASFGSHLHPAIRPETATDLSGGWRRQAAERIRRLHADLGISYFTFSKSAATSWRTLEQLVEALK